ncbi:MAG: hypothetical protein ACPG47_05045 [Leucothrix sp.]
MNSLNKWLWTVGLLLAINIPAVASNKTKLYGNWQGISGSSIQLHLKKNMRYFYRYKMLTFTGKWSVSENNLTFHYSVLGSKKKKKATYALRKGFLTLRAHEHSTVVLKKK